MPEEEGMLSSSCGEGSKDTAWTSSDASDCCSSCWTCATCCGSEATSSSDLSQRDTVEEMKTARRTMTSTARSTPRRGLPEKGSAPRGDAGARVHRRGLRDERDVRLTLLFPRFQPCFFAAESNAARHAGRLLFLEVSRALCRAALFRKSLRRCCVRNSFYRLNWSYAPLLMMAYQDNQHMGINLCAQRTVAWCKLARGGMHVFFS